MKNNEPRILIITIWFLISVIISRLAEVDPGGILMTSGLTIIIMKLYQND